MSSDTEIRLLQERLELVEHERDALLIAVNEATESLGHYGGDADDLRDAAGQVGRLLDGKDLDAEGLEGAALQVQRLIAWAHLGSQAFHGLLSGVAGTDTRPSRAVVLSEPLAAHLSTRLTAEDLYALTTLPLDGVQLDADLLGLFTAIAETFELND